MSNINLRKLFVENSIAQNFRESQWLVERVEKIIQYNTSQNKPSTILEIGIQAGGSMRIWEQLLIQNGYKNNVKDNILIGIDLGNTVAWDTTKSDITVEIVIGNSHDLDTLRLVKKFLFDGVLFKGDMMRPIDFVYIDGEHNPKAAKQDFNMYGNLVRKEGGVGFHDYNDVKRFLDILNQTKLEIFADKQPFEPYGMSASI